MAQSEQTKKNREKISLITLEAISSGVLSSGEGDSKSRERSPARFEEAENSKQNLERTELSAHSQVSRQLQSGAHSGQCVCAKF